MIDATRGFNAVATTGIYCRPGCTGRPNPGNVRKFQLAAAAEAAGYRACLRCRPYRIEPRVSSQTPALVCRAMRLILGGALDDRKSEHDLAARLGVSAGHLRRMFRDHVGTTPDQLARSRRAHFARRLLDETDFTLSDVAFAAGFSSLRQFNRSMNEIFRATPSELRARRRRGDRLVADGGFAMRLLFEPPLDWEALLGYMRAHAISGVETVSDGTYRRTIEIDGDAGVLEFSREGPDHLVLRAHLPHWEGLIHLVERARHVFNLDADAEAAQRQLASDPRIGRVLANHPGLRPPGAWDPFEIGIRAILEQQAEAGVGTIMERLVARHGILVPGLQGVGLSHLFPAPSILASAGLGRLGLTPNSISTIHAFAHSVADGALQLDCSTDLDRFVDSVRRAVPGLQWGWADYIALRLGEPDAFPASDAGIEHYLSRGTKKPSLTWKFTAATADQWRPWRAYAATAMWFDEHQPVHQSIGV